jgi:NAD(P)-dependent dehydrogenase (short-subunit alcohol dehydrogenase family)
MPGATGETQRFRRVSEGGVSLEGRVIIVTGAARGLGAATALGLAQSGARIVAVYRPRGPNLAPADDLPISADQFLRVDADVTDESAVARIVSLAVDRFGVVDVLVNNAVVAHDDFPQRHSTSLLNIDPSLWRRILEVNITGPFLLTRAVIPAMLEQHWGRIINISCSMNGGMLVSTFLPYGPSKAALEAMSHNWARQLSDTGITVNEVLPGGPTGNPDAPETRWPSAIAKWPAEMMIPPIRWLASEASDGVTGRRFVARLWDESREAAVAAAQSGFPLGWPTGAHETIVRPPER